MLQVCIPGTQEQAHQDLIGALYTVHETNNNLGESQREILQRHDRIGRIGFSHLRSLARQNNLPVNNSTAVAICDKVIRAACEFGKAPKRPYDAAKTNPRVDKQ